MGYVTQIYRGSEYLLGIAELLVDLFALRAQLHGYEDRVLEGRAAAAFTKVLHVMQVCARPTVMRV